MRADGAHLAPLRSPQPVLQQGVSVPADLCFHRGPLLAREILHEGQHRRHGVCSQHSARRGQTGRLRDGHARVHGQDGPGVVAPHPVERPAHGAAAVPLPGLQVGQQVIDVAYRLPAPLLADDLVLQHPDALRRLHGAVQHPLHVPDGGCKARIGCRVPQAPLYHVLALFQQNGLVALHALLQKAPALDGGIHLHALDLRRQRAPVYRDGVVVLHGGPVVAQQLHAGLVDEVRGVPPEKVLHVLAPCPVIVRHGVLYRLQNGVGHGDAVGAHQRPQHHGLAALVGSLDVALGVLGGVRQGEAAGHQVVAAVLVAQQHVQAAQLCVVQRHGIALAVLQADVHQLRPRPGKSFHLFQVFLAGHVGKQAFAFHEDLRLPPLAVVQHLPQLLHLAVFGVAAQAPEHSRAAQHVQLVAVHRALRLFKFFPETVALRVQHLVGGLHGHAVHFFGPRKGQGLVFRPDHVQRAGRNGLQHPQLVYRHGQIGAVLRLPDALAQPVPQLFGLVAVRQGLGFFQLLPQPVELCLLAGVHVVPQCLDQLFHAAVLPVGVDAGVHLSAAPDAVLQGGQLGQGVVVQHCHVRQLRYLSGLHDEALLYIFPGLRPQHHLVELGGIVPDAPFQFVRLPSFPGFLYPLFGQCLCHGHVLVPLLPGRFNGDRIPLGLLFLPRFGLALVLGFPFHNLVFLYQQLMLRPVGSPLLSGHLPGQIVDLRAQLSALQLYLVQHLLPGLLHPVLFGLPFSLVGLPQSSHLLVETRCCAHLCAQRFQILVELSFCPAHALDLGALAAAVFPHPVGKSLPLGLLHALQPLRHLSRPLLAAGGHGGHLPVVFQDALKHRLGIGHLRVAHDVADHPARQFHLGVLVFGSVRKPAHHLGLDGVVYVHQHVEPFRALHAGCARHARFLCRRAEECRSALLHAAHGPGAVHDGLVLFRRVAVPVSLCLPQLHAVAPGLGYRLCPASVPLYKLGLGFAVLVYRVGQVVQVGVFVPQLRVPVGRLIQHFACQRLGQSLRLGHVRALRAQILHQRPGLVCQLRPVGPAAVGLGPPDGKALESSVREPGVLRQAEELVQGVKGRSLLRQYPAGLPLLVLLGVPICLLGQLKAGGFLHRFVGSLAFVGGLCYTLFRRYFLGVCKGTQHRFRERCGGIFFFYW